MYWFAQKTATLTSIQHTVPRGGGYNKDPVVFVCAIKADGPLDSHKFSSGSLKGWHQIDLVEAKNKVDKIIEI